MENHTDLSWRIYFGSVNAAVSPGERSWLEVAPRATRRVTLAGGEYVVSREVVFSSTVDAGKLDDSSGTGEKTTLRFEAGRTYTWPLGTVFSQEAPTP